MFKLLSTALVAISLFSVSSEAMAIGLNTLGSRIDEADSMRAEEFSPENYKKARELYQEAKKKYDFYDEQKGKAIVMEGLNYADQAILNSRKFSQGFAELITARDEIHASGSDIRPDLVKQVDDMFGEIVEAFEEGNYDKATKKEKNAVRSIRQIQVVAAQEKYLSPLSKAIKKARDHDASRYAPVAYKEALDNEKKLEKLVRDDPSQSSMAHQLNATGMEQAEVALRIGMLGEEFKKSSKNIETWFDQEHGRWQSVGDDLDVELNATQDEAKKAALLKEGISQLKSSYEKQIKELYDQIGSLNSRLSRSKGDIAAMSQYKSKVDAFRRIQNKVDRLNRRFQPAEVKATYDKEADAVRIHVWGIKFIRGSKTLPSNSYYLLDTLIGEIANLRGKKVRVEGHTDFPGDSGKNMYLSEGRAKSVVDYLTSRSKGRLRNIGSVGYGEERPLSNRPSEINNRIDILIQSPKG